MAITYETKDPNKLMIPLISALNRDKKNQIMKCNIQKQLIQCEQTNLAHFRHINTIQPI